MDDSREEKKSVRFQTPRDNEKAKQISLQFVKEFAGVSKLETVDSALKKFVEYLKPIRNSADALAKFDSSGKGVISVD